MRAMVQISYGPPEVIVLQEIPKTVPGKQRAAHTYSCCQSRAVGLCLSQRQSVYD